MAKTKKAVKKQVPVLVKVISVIGFIGAALTLLFGIMIGIMSAFVGQIATATEISAKELALIQSLGAGFFLFLGIIFVLLALLDFFVARGLWKGNNWARIFMVVILALAALNLLIKIFSGRVSSLIGLVIYGFLIWYLGWNEEVKKSFS